MPGFDAHVLPATRISPLLVLRSPQNTQQTRPVHVAPSTSLSSNASPSSNVVERPACAVHSRRTCTRRFCMAASRCGPERRGSSQSHLRIRSCDFEPKRQVTPTYVSVRQGRPRAVSTAPHSFTQCPSPVRHAPAACAPRHHPQSPPHSHKQPSRRPSHRAQAGALLPDVPPVLPLRYQLPSMALIVQFGPRWLPVLFPHPRLLCANVPDGGRPSPRLQPRRPPPGTRSQKAFPPPHVPVLLPSTPRLLAARRR